MKKSLVLGIFALYALTTQASERVLLECVDLGGDGGITKVQVLADDSKGLLRREFADNGDIEQDRLKQEDFDSHTIPLSSYYGYKRTLKKQGDQWVVDWDCGEQFAASCTEY